MNKTKIIGFAAALLLGAVATAHATVIDLDLTSGNDTFENGATASWDTYRESGFTIQVRAGDHYDRQYIGDLAFHNGPNNSTNTFWTLTYGGAAFSLLGIDVYGFTAGASSFTVTGSNSVSQVISSSGIASVSLLNVTSVTFNLDQDGASQAVGLSGLKVDTAPRAVPDAGSSAGLLAAGLLAVALGRRKLA